MTHWDMKMLHMVGVGLGRLPTGLGQEECALQPIRFRQQVTAPACLQHRQCLGQQAQPLLHLAKKPRQHILWIFRAFGELDRPPRPF